MSFINEKGELTKNAFATYLLLMMLPFTLGIIFNLDKINSVKNMDYMWKWILIEFWGITILLFTGLWMKRREKLWKEKGEGEI